ncbi:DNA polymerase/3'-5' exonuclease PolX [Blastopirellula sp. JC732]|uniref:DNA polymerase beta n=1 Tax=Blastopirellula sediminis TaxID=2894196 RepID=A0A9X1MJM6_9BACT|nr:DNA polymerase/3'-5' exonuclease PolX [Blastopirellula sediminis]MCC9609457.1 DNA polymerase/3'-5' exonuclease PolX [Blastopirellula sediminis]MCC9627766.1 DNA polymerase/3'-5' exonuclease PolX [Blastopirellula sediminis]
MTNEQIANRFETLADLLEFDGANSFRVRAYRNAARTIHDLGDPLSTMVDQGRDLTELDGIGDDLAKKIVVMVNTGHLPALEDILKKIPATVLAILRIPGLGPKKAAVLHKELGINDLDQLKQACVEHRVKELKGFGAKTEETILKGIKIAAAADERTYWSKADLVVQDLLAHLKTCKSIERIEPAGSYRRGKETIGDIDLLSVSTDSQEVMDRFAEFPLVEETIARGDTKMSVRLETGLQVDLRVVPAESFGAALQYFTGSKEHNVRVRSIAKQKGLKVNEWGVFRVEENGDETYVVGAEEADVYAALDLPWFPPEMREDREEFRWAESGKLPELIVESDLQGDLHMHTHASDGANSLEEMVAAARAKGLKYIAITDHSQRVSMANGLDSERLLEQWKMIDEFRKTIDDDFLVLKGIECDILEQGGMDLPDEVLAQADWVIGSVHYGQNQPKRQITDRIIGALENRYVCMIAHPTGRLINNRPPYEVDLEEVFQAAIANKKFLELNAAPKRLDLNDVYCAAAKQRGIPIVINTDAHRTEGLLQARYGILQARRGGLTKADVANTRSWAEMQKMLGR